MNRDRIDSESLEALDALLEFVPGGLNAIPNVVERRDVFRQLNEDARAELPANTNVVSEDRTVAGPPGAPDIALRIFRPASASGELPGIYYIHGGGMVMGSVDGEALVCEILCEAISAVVVSVEYRLAPESPYPSAVEDCYAGFSWMAAHARQLGIVGDRLAIYGGSAGGGLTIATALIARDRDGPKPCFMMAAYPMIDDRNETSSSREITDVGIWDRDANLEAWGWYLDGKPADGYAAPARAKNIGGLPPAFIDVGEVDLFRDEDITFAARLLQAGVPTELHVYPGSYHASEIIAPDARLSSTIWARRIDALKNVLHPGKTVR